MLSAKCNVAQATLLIKLEYFEHWYLKIPWICICWHGMEVLKQQFLYEFILYIIICDQFIKKCFLVQPNLIIIKVWQLKKKIRILNTDHDSVQLVDNLGVSKLSEFRFCDPPWALSFIMVRTLYYTKLEELVLNSILLLIWRWYLSNYDLATLRFTKSFI